MQDILYYNIKKVSNTLSSMIKNKMDFMSVNVDFIVGRFSLYNVYFRIELVIKLCVFVFVFLNDDNIFMTLITIRVFYC